MDDPVMRSAAEALRAARSRVADAMLPRESVPERLGEILLRPHQLEAAERLQALVHANGGALLADEVGWGKTYVALAVACRARALAVLVPASLRENWQRALARTGVQARVLGLEHLARRSAPDVHPDLVIVDESHRLRNPSTRTYRSVAAMCRHARVILLSATPMQNRRSDLEAQLALFLGARTTSMTDEQLGACVVRRRPARDAPVLPRLDGPHWLHLPMDDDLLDALLDLPAPIGPADAGDGGALLGFALARRWASSRGALVASLRRRLATAIALESALEEGRRPTRRELSAWLAVDDSLQLAFPGLAASAVAAASDLLPAVRAQRCAVEALLTRLRASPDADCARSMLLRGVCERHPDEIVLAFSEYADTIAALARHLARVGGVAWLTSQGGRMASGAVSRREIIAQLSAEGRPPSKAEHIRLLLSTDVLSEGLDLQRASVVVHLDLPWNPARLQQRVGRVRRMGARREVVTVYALAPPASSERLIEIERRLREKLRVAARVVGVAGGIMPPLWNGHALEEAGPAVTGGAPEAASEIVSLLARWRGDAVPSLAAEGGCAAAAVRTRVAGFVALVRGEDGAALVAQVGGRLTTGTTTVLDALRLVEEGDPVQADPVAVAAASEEVLRWHASRRAANTVDLAVTSEPARRRVLSRIDAIVSRAPRHTVAHVAALASRARSAAVAPLSVGSERVLGTIAAARLDDLAWLKALDAFAQANGVRPHHDPDDSVRVTAVILLVCLTSP